MPMKVRFDGSVVVLSNFARLMNDPRHFDAVSEVRALLDEGHRRFVLDLTGLRELADAGIGLLTTLTRLIRQHGGEAVLANVRRETGRYLEDMRMDAFWDVYTTIHEATSALSQG